jgi:hypothetical protein
METIRALLLEGYTLERGVPVVEFTGTRRQAAQVVLRDNRPDGDWNPDLLRTFLEDVPIPDVDSDWSGVSELVEAEAVFPRAGKTAKRSGTEVVIVELLPRDFETIVSASRETGLSLDDLVVEALRGLLTTSPEVTP